MTWMTVSEAIWDKKKRATRQKKSGMIVYTPARYKLANGGRDTQSMENHISSKVVTYWLVIAAAALQYNNVHQGI